MLDPLSLHISIGSSLLETMNVAYGDATTSILAQSHVNAVLTLGTSSVTIPFTKYQVANFSLKALGPTIRQISRGTVGALLHLSKRLTIFADLFSNILLRGPQYPTSIECSALDEIVHSSQANCRELPKHTRLSNSGPFILIQ